MSFQFISRSSKSRPLPPIHPVTDELESTERRGSHHQREHFGARASAGSAYDKYDSFATKRDTEQRRGSIASPSQFKYTADNVDPDAIDQQADPHINDTAADINSSVQTDSCKYFVVVRSVSIKVTQFEQN